MRLKLVLYKELHVGDVLHKFTLLKCLGSGNYGDELWLCECKCGNKVSVSSFQLLNGLLSCKKCSRKYRDLEGQTFDKLTAILYCGKGRWICSCECGKLTRVSSYDLCRGTRTRCSSCAQIDDLRGKMFGYWKVLSRAESRNGHILWNCICTKCGTKRKVFADSLKRPHTLSCGCCTAETLREYHTTHGMTKTRIYNIWAKIKERCFKPNSPAYKYYGSRGIKICDRWKDSFENFRDDMYESYLKHVEEYGEKNTTLDRIDVNGDYCPENCRWATWNEQADNRRNSEIIVLGREAHNLTEWCRLLNLCQGTLIKWKKKFNLTNKEVLLRAIDRFNVDMGEYYD